MAGASYGHLRTDEVAESVALALKVYEAAQTAGLKDVADGALALASTILDDVQKIATEIAALADGLIIRNMLVSHAPNRPLQGEMETHVASAPGPLGTVNVGLLEELDKIVNRNGYGPFWRAQEFGTNSDEVKSQRGRTFLGTFEPSGDVPLAAQRGPQKGTDLAFVSSRGSDAGMGTISEELPGRHFLKDGATEAGVRYVAAINAAQTQWLAEIQKLMAMVRDAARLKRYRFQIKA